MTDKLITIEKQIHRLKERRNKLYAQQAVLFYKEVEKIFKRWVLSSSCFGYPHQNL
jgi:hypothetical protein